MRAALEPRVAGAVDLHVHGYPDVSLRLNDRYDDAAATELARAYGMRGYVLKSHFWPTMDRARALNRTYGSDRFTVFSSITLNPLAGGLSPIAVEAAAGHGAKVVFLPTWGARHDDCEGGFVRRHVIDPEYPSFAGYLAQHAIAVVDDDGRLVPAVHELIALCKARGLVLCTGHISIDESLAVARAAAAAGFDKLVLSHPCSPTIRAGVERLVEIAELGATIEFTPLAPDRPGEAAAAIARIGAARCVASTDTFSAWQPPAPENLRTYAERLRFAGCSDADLHHLLVATPWRLLDLAPSEECP